MRWEEINKANKKKINKKTFVLERNGTNHAQETERNPADERIGKSQIDFI